MILLMMLIIIIALANQPLSHATEIWSHFRASGWLRRDSKCPHIYSTVCVRAHPLPTWNPSRPGNHNQLWSICALVTQTKNTYLWMKSFLLKMRRLQRLGDHKQIALPATRGHQRVTTPLFTECKELNLSKSIKFLTKLHFNFIFPPPFYFSDIPYIVQFWYTTVLFTPVEVHQQVRKFTTR